MFGRIIPPLTVIVLLALHSVAHAQFSGPPPTLFLQQGDNVAVSGSGTSGIYQGQPVSGQLITTSVYNSAYTVSNSSLTLNSGANFSLNIFSEDNAAITSRGTTTINGGTIYAESSIERDAIGVSTSGSTLTINGGTISGVGVGNHLNVVGLSLSSGGTDLGSTTINGGTITATYNSGYYPNLGYYATAMSTSQNTTINGGTIFASGPNAVGIAVGGATVTIKGGNISVTGQNATGLEVSGVVVLFGTGFSDGKGHSFTVPITHGSGTIVGTLADGEAINTNYFVQSGKIEFATPPVAITGVRLNIPQLASNPKALTRTLVQSVYVRGAGIVTISGHWVDNGVAGSEISVPMLNLSSGNWTRLIDLTTSNANPINGNHKLQFVVDSPNATSTSVEDIAVTGFIPSVWGWSFLNTPNLYTAAPTYVSIGLPYLDFYFYGYDGLCDGFTESSRDYYDHITSNLPNRISPPKPISILLHSDYTEGNAWFSHNDLQRVISGIEYPFDVNTYKAALSNEATRIVSQIQKGDPCVIQLLPLIEGLGQGLSAGHSVVGTASFVSQNIYDSNNQNEIDTMHLFSIYDCNFFDKINPIPAPANDRYLGEFDTSYPVPQFVFIPQVLNYNKYTMWVQSTFHQ